MVTEAELDLLGVAILDPRITEAVHLNEPDFAQPVHGAAWEAIRELHRKGQRPDPTTVVTEAQKRGVRVEHQLLVDVVGRGFAPNADHYGELIRADHHRRRLVDAMNGARQLLDNGAPLDEVAAKLSPALATGETEHHVEKALTLDEFCDQELPADEWVIPDLLARGDRAIITGSEGFGKTVLIRQLAICAAAGMQPFTFADAKPARVLMVDAENPLRVMVKSMSRIRNNLLLRGKGTDDRMWIDRHPQGMDLGKASDRLALHSLCRMFRPDLLVIGPAYKLYVGGSNQREEDLARTVTSTLDGLREEFGFALILEHHSPHAAPGQKRTTRPIGSSLWQRWPEFGIGLGKPDAEPQKDPRTGRKLRVAAVEHWRGMRDFRPWPDELTQGETLPWVDSDPHATMAKGAA